MLIGYIAPLTTRVKQPLSLSFFYRKSIRLQATKTYTLTKVANNVRKDADGGLCTDTLCLWCLLPDLHLSPTSHHRLYARSCLLF